MDITLAVCCVAANVSREGKLNLLGIFNSIHAAEFPCTHPHLALVRADLRPVPEPRPAPEVHGRPPPDLERDAPEDSSVPAAHAIDEGKNFSHGAIEIGVGASAMSWL